MTIHDLAPASAVTRARVAVGVVFFVHGMLFASWAAHISQVKARLGIDDAALGVALLGVPIGSVSAIGLIAYLVPRLGSRRMVQLVLVGYCLSGPLVGLAGSVPALFGALLLWGAFQGGLDIAMNTQAITVERAVARPLMNGMHAWWGIGAFAGAGIGTLGVAIGVSLAVQLTGLGVIAVLGAGWQALRMLTDPRHARAEPDHARRRRMSVPILLLGGIAFAAMLCEGAAADWSSVYLRESLGTSAAIGGLGYTSFTLALVLVRIFGDRLVERHGARVLLPLLAGVAAVGFGVGLALDVAWAGVAGFFVLGLGLGAVVPLAFSAAGRLPGIHPGVGVAAVSALGWAGFVCGPPLIGQLSAAFSLPAALTLVPALAAFIAIATRHVAGLQPQVKVPTCHA